MHIALQKMSSALEKLAEGERIFQQFGIIHETVAYQQGKDSKGFAFTHDVQKSGYHLHWYLGYAEVDKNDPNVFVLFELSQGKQMVLGVTYCATDGSWTIDHISPQLRNSKLPGEVICAIHAMGSMIQEIQAFTIISTMARIFSTVASNNEFQPT